MATPDFEKIVILIFLINAIFNITSVTGTGHGSVTQQLLVINQHTFHHTDSLFPPAVTDTSVGMTHEKSDRASRVSYLVTPFNFMTVHRKSHPGRYPFDEKLYGNRFNLPERGCAFVYNST